MPIARCRAFHVLFHSGTRAAILFNEVYTTEGQHDALIFEVRNERFEETAVARVIALTNPDEITGCERDPFRPLTENTTRIPVVKDYPHRYCNLCGKAGNH